MSTADKSMVLTIEDTRREYKIGVNAQYNAIRNGDLKARKLGRKTIILRADLGQWLSSLPALDLANNPHTPTVRNLNPIGRRKRAVGRTA